MLDMTNKDMSCIKHQVLRVIDILIGCFIIAPLVVLYWRSTWKLMDLYIVPSYPEISGIICTIGGFTLSFIIVLFHQEISLRTSNCNIVLLQTIRSVLVYVTSLGCILYWRGVWLVLDHVTPRTWMSYLACHSISLLILLTTKTVSSIVSPPGVLVNDIHVNSPSITTVGFHNDEDSIGKTICNALLTVVIVGSAVVGYWRGTWLILDHITINISDLYNSLLSCSIGCGVCIICYIIAEPLQEKVPDMTSWIAIVGEHVFVYILGASTVSVWRGFWIMSDILILQGSPIPAALITHFVTLLTLFVGQAASNLPGTPVGCRLRKEGTFQGFSMGSFLAPAKSTENPQDNNENKLKSSRNDIT